MQLTQTTLQLPWCSCTICNGLQGAAQHAGHRQERRRTMVPVHHQKRFSTRTDAGSAAMTGHSIRDHLHVCALWCAATQLAQDCSGKAGLSRVDEVEERLRHGVLLHGRAASVPSVHLWSLLHAICVPLTYASAVDAQTQGFGMHGTNLLARSAPHVK